MLRYAEGKSQHQPTGLAFIDYLRARFGRLGAHGNDAALRAELSYRSLEKAAHIGRAPSVGDDFDRLVAAVEPHERDILERYFREGETLNEIAAARGVSESRVSQQVSAITEKLRRVIDLDENWSEDVRQFSRRVRVDPMEQKRIDLDKIVEGENSRSHFGESEIQELMGSMKKNGLLQAIGVRPVKNGKYEVVWGNRRLEAARKLDWAQIPATIVEAKTETDRDVLNMIENLKRKDLPVADYGRMYDMLKKRGLTEGEIAARLDEPLPRVLAALDVFYDVPKEYHSKIVHAGKGAKKKGAISATLAKQVINLRKTHNLSKKDMGKLLDYAAKGGVSVQNLQAIAPVVRLGNSVRDAIKKVEGLRTITLTVVMDRAVSERLERKHEKSINEILLDLLAADRSLRIQRAKKESKSMQDFPKLRSSQKYAGGGE